MTREELLQIAKPILFNTDMVRAILDGRKTVTRRHVKYKYSNTEMRMRTDKYGTRLIEIQKDVEGETHGKNPDGTTWHKLRGYIEPKPPYKKGDYLYVRETWCRVGEDVDKIYFEHSDNMWDGMYLYKADGTDLSDIGKWHPSIHMPKEAARIFLRVKDIRVERVQNITEEQSEKEGAIDNRGFIHSPGNEYDNIHTAREHFKQIWNATIPKKDLDKYGWDANPWVWAIEFKRVEVKS